MILARLGRMWVWILGILLILGAVYYFYYNRTATPVDTRAIGPFELIKKPDIATAQSARMILANTNTGSLQFFVYPLPFDRTGIYTGCSDTPRPGEPDCSTGRYNLCVCSGTDCSVCDHAGYATIVNISNIVKLELLNSPDASRRKAAAAQLAVRTLRTSPTIATVVETLTLPNIPFQKWTMITIAREGRRFDVYYNNSLVFSKRAQFPLDIRSFATPIQVGDSKLQGKVAQVEAYPEKLTAVDVSRHYSTYANTNGEPYLDTVKIPVRMPFCKGGQCFKGPNVRPASPLLDWETEYA